jgi:hypothetical protein
VAHEVLAVLPSDTRLPAYAAIVSVPLHAQQPAQIRVRIGAAVSGLGLETAPVASPNVMQPLTQRMNRLGHQSPPTPQRFFVIISTFLQKTIMIQTHRPFWKCDIVKLKSVYIRPCNRCNVAPNGSFPFFICQTRNMPPSMSEYQFLDL